nr:reverse transcriptase domain-containing protein [Paraburkholderia nodosa]
MSQIPVHPRPKRLSNWINPMEARKAHSLVDKVYQRKNQEVAWERVRAKRGSGSGGVDGISVADFADQADQHLDRLQAELRAWTYQPQPVRQVSIPKVGKPGETRKLGIPSIYDRVCQQALLNRLEPIFEPVFDEATFRYRPGRSTQDALRKIWKEIEGGREWIVDADLKDFFGSVDHDKLLSLIARRITDGRVLRLIKAMLKAGSFGKGRLFPSERGTPQGGVASGASSCKATCAASNAGAWELVVVPPALQDGIEPSNQLDRAAHLVASIQALAQHWLEGLAGGVAVWRVRVGQPVNLVQLIPSLASQHAASS